MKKRLTEEQIIRILRGPSEASQQVNAVCHKHNITEHFIVGTGSGLMQVLIGIQK